MWARPGGHDRAGSATRHRECEPVLVQKGVVRSREALKGLGITKAPSLPRLKLQPGVAVLIDLGHGMMTYAGSRKSFFLI
jgi:hypothetical protein